MALTSCKKGPPPTCHDASQKVSSFLKEDLKENITAPSTQTIKVLADSIANECKERNWPPHTILCIVEAQSITALQSCSPPTKEETNGQPSLIEKH